MRTAQQPRQAPARSRPGTRRPAPEPFLDRQIELGSATRRGSALLIVTILVFSTFILRLVDLQAVRGETLASAALDQRLRTVDLPAQRGAILDASGQPLAVTVEARNLTVDQTLVTDPQAVADALSPILGADADVLLPRLIGERRFVYVAKGLTPETWRRIEAMALPGVFSERTSRRVYPGGDLAANIVGFVDAEGVGSGGIEYALESTLAGAAGSRTYERGPGGKAIPTAKTDEVAATPGANVQLTIDRDIQYRAQQVLAAQVEKSGSDWGSVIVMDPRTGDILAMATAPTFDANQPGIAPTADRGNRALTHAFEPGSTGKVMTLAAVIDQGEANPYSWFKVPGALQRGDKLFHDHNEHGTLHLTLAGIMAKSSNIGTIIAAERIGGRQLYAYEKRFGVGEPTGLDFPAENSGSIPVFGKWSPTSLPTIAFGQGLSMNAVQQASVYATIANDGVRVPPRLVSSVEYADGTVEAVPVGKGTRVVSPQTATQVRAMLEAVTQDGGTAPMARIPGYRVGGKTGTAQMVKAGGGYGKGVVASFIGMAPVDNPQLVVAVSLVNPRAGRFGGELGAPVFKDVMTYALQAREIPPTGTKPSKLTLGS